jgi:putative transposase
MKNPIARLFCDTGMAIQQLQSAQGFIVLSDRGSQYASNEYQALLNQHGIICSTNRKGGCWDNEVAELLPES